MVFFILLIIAIVLLGDENFAIILNED